MLVCGGTEKRLLPVARFDVAVWIRVLHVTKTIDIKQNKRTTSQMMLKNKKKKKKKVDYLFNQDVTMAARCRRHYGRNTQQLPTVRASTRGTNQQNGIKDKQDIGAVSYG